MKNLIIKIAIAIIFIIAIVANCNATNVPTAKVEFQNSQFLVTIAQNGHTQMVNDYLWLIDNSDYELCIETWTMFCRYYNLVMKAKRDIRSGFDVDLNTILD